MYIEDAPMFKSPLIVFFLYWKISLLRPNRSLFQSPLALYLPSCKYILPLKWGRKLFSYIDPSYEVKQTNAYVKAVVYNHLHLQPR